MSFYKCPYVGLNFLLLGSSQNRCTVSTMAKGSKYRYNVVTMAAKMEFHFSVKMGHFAKT